ncbi:MAG TPA: sulfatase [Candidatus Limnocylindrales bacterium]|nr:sulfatase [Candidatus Limnocylindrales bacterium]
MIVIDTLRADRVAAYGGAPEHMPALARWAEQAAVFREAVSVAPFTMPAVAALMTGAYPDRSGIFIHASGVTLHDFAGQTLAELARGAGLRTGAVVSNPWLARPATGFDRGFEHYAAHRDDEPVSLRGANARSVTDSALRILDGFGSSPFFLWVHYFDPHMPYRPPAEHAAAAGAASTDSRVMRDFSADDRDLTRIYSGADYAPADVAQAMRLYEGELRYVDEQLARLLARLDSSGRSDETLVVIVSDHGEAMGEHGLFFAHDYTVYDELVRAVLMMRGPGVPSGHRHDLASPIDVVPTLCRMMGWTCGGDLDGVDLFDPSEDRTGRTLFAAATPFRRRAAAFPRLQVKGVDGRWTMARRGRHKLIKIPQRRRTSAYELYDLSADPAELNNLYEGRRDALQADLAAALDAWETSMAETRPAARRARPDPQDEETLRSLGYLQ